MITRENTLSERERFVLSALVSDADSATARRARALLEWSHGASNEGISETTGLRPYLVRYLTRSFSQKRLEVFSASSIERASRGLAGPATVDQLLQKHHVDLAHARYVCGLALRIFDETTAVHHLEAEWRRLLETGALLHNVGANADDDELHHRAGREILLAHDLDGFSPRERDVLGILVAYHKKKVKASRDAVFAELDEATQRATLALAAILRVADGLDYSQSQSTNINSIDVNALVDVVVEGPHAEADVGRANKKADLWRQVISPPFYARLAGGTLPAPSSLKSPKPKTGVRGHDPITRAGKKIISAQFARVQSLEDEVRGGSNVQALHDMRVATRRMRSAFRLLAKFYPRKTVRRLRAPLRQLAQDLGAMRDLDVLIENLVAYTARLSLEQQRALDPLLADWQARRAWAHRTLVDFLDGKDYGEWLARVEDFIEEKDDAVARRVADVVPELVWKLYGRVRAYEPRLQDPSLPLLHALRIECKRLRYALEFFAEPLGENVPALIEPVIALQDHLGSLHDADVASHLIAEFIAARARYAQRHGGETGNFEGVAAYLAALQSRMAELQAGVDDRWRVVNRFAFRKALAEATSLL